MLLQSGTGHGYDAALPIHQAHGLNEQVITRPNDRTDLTFERGGIGYLRGAFASKEFGGEDTALEALSSTYIKYLTLDLDDAKTLVVEVLRSHVAKYQD